jgi:hypothetical protein
MSPKMIAGEWVVTTPDGRVMTFTSNAAAWVWIDRNTHQGRDDYDRFYRIQTAFNW